MIDPKQLPDDPDAWVKPDISQPRTTVDFINDVWAGRKSPVYSLRPLEVSILQSKTFKGWLWRAIVGIIRHKKISKWSACPPPPDPNVTLGKLADGTIGFMPDPVSEATMRHYIAVTEKFHPIAPTLPPATEQPATSAYACTCDCSSLEETAPPKKPRKKPRKKPAKKRPQAAKRR